MGRTANTLPRFDSNLQEGDQISASQWNALANLLNGIKAFDGIWIKATANGLHIGGGGSAVCILYRAVDNAAVVEGLWQVVVKAVNYDGGMTGDPITFHVIPEDESGLAIPLLAGQLCIKVVCEDGPAVVAVGSFQVRGTPDLYKVVMLRYWDADGNMVNPGDETESDVLYPTWDWPRMR